MDIRLGIGCLSSSSSSSSHTLCSSTSRAQKAALKPCCSSRRGSQQPPQQNGDNNQGDKFSTDWDKAWKSFRKQGKKSLFGQFSLDKYVSWNPRRSEYPLSEEIDPIKRTERSNLTLWTSPRFTLVGAIVIVSFLLVYTILAPLNNRVALRCMTEPSKRDLMQLDVNTDDNLEILAAEQDRIFMAIDALDKRRAH